MSNDLRLVWGRLEQEITDVRWARRNVYRQLAAWPIHLKPREVQRIVAVVLHPRYARVRRAMTTCERSGMVLDPSRLCRLWGVRDAA